MVSYYWFTYGYECLRRRLWFHTIGLLTAMNALGEGYGFILLFNLRAMNASEEGYGFRLLVYLHYECFRRRL